MALLLYIKSLFYKVFKSANVVIEPFLKVEFYKNKK